MFSPPKKLKTYQNHIKRNVAGCQSYVKPNHMKPFSQECLGPQIPFSILHVLENNIAQVDEESFPLKMKIMVSFEGA